MRGLIIFIIIALLCQTFVQLFAVETAYAGLGKSAALSGQTDVAELAQEIARRQMRVKEFEVLREAAQELGLRIWLFGGTAAGYAHYVKWDLLRQKGDSRFLPNRFDYDFTSIYRSTQDADLVVDGSVEDALKLEALIKEKLAFFQGAKDDWEIRLLRKDRGGKQALLNNPDFFNQHTDSNSTGIIEITVPPPGESAVRDLRDWGNHQDPQFLRDVSEGKLHYYYGDKHSQTKFFKDGRNPEIFSVIRFLTKAFQYDLEIRSQDMEKIKEIIERFNPAKDITTDYAKKRIATIGISMIRHAVNLEYASNILEFLGLRKKLISISDPSVMNTMGWWLNRAPLPTKPLGQGRGKTAAELKIETVAHETSDYIAYESITRAHTGEPNVLKSRQNVVGEMAIHGDGFYTRKGREGARGSGMTIRFHVHPEAREGEDFFVAAEGEYVVILNKAAIRVIPETLKISAVEYFELLEQGKLIFDSTDKAVQESVRRKIGGQLAVLSLKGIHSPEVQKIKSIIVNHIEDSRRKNGWIQNENLLNEWFSLPIALKFPDVIRLLLDYAAQFPAYNRRYYMEYVERSISAQPGWASQHELMKDVIELSGYTEILSYILRTAAWKQRPEYVDKILAKERIVSGNFLIDVLKDPESAKYSRWIEYCLDMDPSSILFSRLLSEVLWLPHWQARTDLIDKIIEKHSQDYGVMTRLIASILGRSYSAQHSKWVEKLLEIPDLHGPLVDYALNKEHWAHRPDYIRRIFFSGNGDVQGEIIDTVFTKKAWAHHQEFYQGAYVTDKVFLAHQRIFAESVVTNSNWDFGLRKKWIQHILDTDASFGYPSDFYNHLSQHLSSEEFLEIAKFIFKYKLHSSDHLYKFAETFLSRPESYSHPEWVEAVIASAQALNHERTLANLAYHQLRNDGWKKYPQYAKWIEMLILRDHIGNEALIPLIEGAPDSIRASLMLKLIKARTTGKVWFSAKFMKPFARTLLRNTYYNSPDYLQEKVDEALLRDIFKNDPLLRKYSDGQAPTVDRIREGLKARMWSVPDAVPIVAPILCHQVF